MLPYQVIWRGCGFTRTISCKLSGEAFLVQFINTTRFYPRCILECTVKLLLPLRSVATRFDPCRREFSREAKPGDGWGVLGFRLANLALGRRPQEWVSFVSGLVATRRALRRPSPCSLALTLNGLFGNESAPVVGDSPVVSVVSLR